MPDKVKISTRDEALVNILERMVSQLQKQDLMLEDVVGRQEQLSQAMKDMGFHRDVQHTGVSTELDKLRESFSRYRSDMLSLVNEQDGVNRNLDDLIKRTGTIAYASEKTSMSLEELEKRIAKQEQAVHDHYEYSLRQGEAFPKEMADISRQTSKLHMETEKSLERMHGEVRRQLEKLRSETARRLLALDNIESVLQTILIRTEPPEKKTPAAVRLFRRIYNLFVGVLFRILRRLKGNK